MVIHLKQEGKRSEQSVEKGGASGGMMMVKGDAHGSHEPRRSVLVVH